MDKLSDTKIAIVGLGYVGLANAMLLAQKNEVVALDISSKTVTLPAASVTAHASDYIAWQAVVTAATLTAVAGRGYPINTTSNACTVTLELQLVQEIQLNL